MGVTFLQMNWIDADSFVIPQADLCSCVEFIHDALTAGSSVLVYCAQVSVGVFNMSVTCKPLSERTHPYFNDA